MISYHLLTGSCEAIMVDLISTHEVQAVQWSPKALVRHCWMSRISRCCPQLTVCVLRYDGANCCITSAIVTITASGLMDWRPSIGALHWIMVVCTLLCPRQVLQCFDVHAFFQRMRGESVPEDMKVDLVGDGGLSVRYGSTHEACAPGFAGSFCFWNLHKLFCFSYEDLYYNSFDLVDIAIFRFGSTIS